MRAALAGTSFSPARRLLRRGRTARQSRRTRFQDRRVRRDHHRPGPDAAAGRSRRLAHRARGQSRSSAGDRVRLGGWGDVWVCARNGATGRAARRSKPQNVAYISFLYRSCALLSPRVDSPQPQLARQKPKKLSPWERSARLSGPQPTSKEPECYDDRASSWAC